MRGRNPSLHKTIVESRASVYALLQNAYWITGTQSPEKSTLRQSFSSSLTGRLYVQPDAISMLSRPVKPPAYQRLQGRAAVTQIPLLERQRKRLWPGDFKRLQQTGQTHNGVQHCALFAAIQNNKMNRMPLLIMCPKTNFINPHLFR